MEFFDTIKRRKSIRSFTDVPVSRKELEQILMAANAAPVGSANYENLRISVVENQEIMDKLSMAVRKMVQDRSKMKEIAGKKYIASRKNIQSFLWRPNGIGSLTQNA